MNDDSLEIKHSSLISTKKTKRRKIVFLGAPGVGKSAIIIRFKDDIFVDYYNPTIETIHKKSFSFQNDNIELEILDYDGQTEYTIMSLSKFSYGINGYILCYSVENLQSFELISILFSKISTFSIDIPKIIVGNKSDLSNKRVISYEEGKNLANKLGCMFIECSAKNSTNINKLFHEMIVEMYQAENNLDIRRICCKKVLKYFSNNKQTLKRCFYITVMINMLFSLCYIILGFYLGITSQIFHIQMIQIASILFIGFWNFLFGIIGFYGLSLKKNEYFNYFKISLILSLAFLILMSLMYLLIRLNAENYDVPEYLIYILLTNLVVQVIINLK